MTRPSFIRTLAAVCVSAMLAVALSGCMQQTANQGNEQQSENREYMTQVNQKMDDLDAVSRGDVVTMRTQADNAFKVLDDLSSLEAPEPLKDVAAGYVDGANSLKDALNSYIQLYTEIDGATTTDPFDWSTYDSRLQAIQDAYNAGIDKLKAADEAAAGKD